MSTPFERCLDMLGDVPGKSLEDKLTNYIGNYMALQLEGQRLRSDLELSQKAVDVLESNARQQAKLLADTGRDLERARGTVERLTEKADEQTTALDQIMTTCADNLAAPASDLKMTLEFIQHVAEHTLAVASTGAPATEPSLTPASPDGRGAA